jgi:hypothetical protein
MSHIGKVRLNKLYINKSILHNFDGMEKCLDSIELDMCIKRTILLSRAKLGLHYKSHSFEYNWRMSKKSQPHKM